MPPDGHGRPTSKSWPLPSVDCCGALILSNGSRVVTISDATIRFANGLAFYRCPGRGPSVPIWEFVA